MGPHDSGKSTTARILSAYATRLDRTPIFADLDVGLGALSVPGCIGAIPLDKTSFSIEVGTQEKVLLHLISLAFYRTETSVQARHFCITSGKHLPRTMLICSNI